MGTNPIQTLCRGLLLKLIILNRDLKILLQKVMCSELMKLKLGQDFRRVFLLGKMLNGKVLYLRGHKKMRSGERYSLKKVQVRAVYMAMNAEVRAGKRKKVSLPR